MIMNNSISYAYFPSNKYAKNSEMGNKLIIFKKVNMNMVITFQNL